MNSGYGSWAQVLVASLVLSFAQIYPILPCFSCCYLASAAVQDFKKDPSHEEVANLYFVDLLIHFLEL